MYFLNINKPKGISSFDVIRILRKKLNIKQIGHSGTLDPLASGVMQIAVGGCTKLLDYLNSDKIYIADMKFGYITETYDSEAEEIFVKKPNFTKTKFEEILKTFIGISKQIPPKYSAVKINGKRACDIMRFNNIDININARDIEIYSIELLEFNNNKAKIRVHCKKGTYIRSLIHDIGLKLKCGAYMTDLTRTQAGDFKIENSNSLDDNNFREINPLDALNLSKYELNEEEYNRIINGNFITSLKNFKTEKILLTKNNKLVSIANLSDNQIKPKKIFKEEVK